MHGLDQIDTTDAIDSKDSPRRHVSPAILEWRIETLKLELANEKRAHRCTKFRLKEAEQALMEVSR